MKKNLTLISLMLGVMLLVSVAGVVSAVSISTDKDDYEPGEIVLISGEGFNPNSELTVVMVRPDGTVESCEVLSCDATFLDGALTSDSSGAFSNYQYDLNGDYGEYAIEVSDGDNVAYVIFTDCCPSTYIVDTYESDYSTLQDVFDQGETVYGKGERTGCGDPDVRLSFRNPSNVVVHTCSPSKSPTTCAWGLPSNAPLGEWDIQIQRDMGIFW